MTTIGNKINGRFPLGGEEICRDGIRKVQVDLQRVIRDARVMPEQALEASSMRKTLDNLGKTMEKNGISDETLAAEGLPELCSQISKFVKDNGLTTEKLVGREPRLAQLALTFGSYFRQSTWANFSNPERLLTTIRNVYNGAAIEFSWAMTKLGPRASFTNTPDLGELFETVLVERLISSARAVTGISPAGILIMDESASIYNYTKNHDGMTWEFDNTDFRNNFMKLLGDDENRIPIVFVAQEIEHGRVMDLHETYRGDGEHHRVVRTRRLIEEALGREAGISAPMFAALMDSRKRTLHNSHRTFAASYEEMRKLHGEVLHMHGSENADAVLASEIATHITKIGRLGEMSASSLGTETGHGVPVIGLKGGLASRPQLRILPEADLLETVERAAGNAELVQITDGNNFMAYYLGQRGELPSASDLQEIVPKSIGGTAIELKNVRSAEHVIADTVPGISIESLKRE